MPWFCQTLAESLKLNSDDTDLRVNCKALVNIAMAIRLLVEQMLAHLQAAELMELVNGRVFRCREPS